MAVATTVARVAFVPPYQGTVNLRLATDAGVSPATPLLVAGDVTVVPQVQLPFGEWKCEVTALPTKGRMFFRVGDTVTG